MPLAWIWKMILILLKFMLFISIRENKVLVYKPHLVPYATDVVGPKFLQQLLYLSDGKDYPCFSKILKRLHLKN